VHDHDHGAQAQVVAREGVMIEQRVSNRRGEGDFGRSGAPYQHLILSDAEIP